MGPVRFYRAESAAPDRLAAARARSPGHEARLWRPGAGQGAVPPGAGHAFQVYGAMHRLHLFANRDYSALILSEPGHEPAHVSAVFPGFARFPFMAPDDLQIGATRTRPEARGQGLATRAILEIMAALARPGRRFWYLTEAGNAASCRAIETAGFACVGTGAKRPRLGLRALGYYAMSETD